MSVVQEVKQNPKKPDNAFIKFLDGTEAWCPSFEAASKLVIGEPLPDGWTQDEGQYGPRAFPPKPQGGRGGGAPAAFRNTKEGFLLEQDSIHRSVALAQAVELAKIDGAGTGWEYAADQMYAWLRKTAPLSGAVGPPSSGDSGAQAGGGPSAAVTPPPAATSAAGHKDAGRVPPAAAQAAVAGGGLGKAPACPACGSTNISFTRGMGHCGACDQEWKR